jgi:hypothetical protein
LTLLTHAGSILLQDRGMPNNRGGRPRLTVDDFQDRVRAYCARHGARPDERGMPPFPTGRRETPQHREWLMLYKLHNRLGRRTRGQCERCSAPVSEGSVFCDTHRAGVAARAGLHGASLEDRQRLLAAQAGRCPVCGEEVELWDSLDHAHGTGELRAVLHQRCNALVGLAETLGPEALARTRQYLWGRRKAPGRRAR